MERVKQKRFTLLSLSEKEKTFIANHLHLTNKTLLNAFNAAFGYDVGLTHLRILMYENGLKRYDKGTPYSDFEKAFVKAHIEKLTNKAIAALLGRTPKSVGKLCLVANAVRSEAARRVFRRNNGLLGWQYTKQVISSKGYICPQIQLTDNVIRGTLKRNTNLTDSDIPSELIEIQRIKILNNRIIQKIKRNGKSTNS